MPPIRGAQLSGGAFGLVAQARNSKVAAMGVAGSPLRDRVIFVEGAPRSGTTWLVTLLATHPEIAGVEAESHLFDFGTDRLFDNLEQRHTQLRGLQAYLNRDELVDLVRDLCDGVLMAMRKHVSAGAEPPFVVEKTPVAARRDGLDIVRKADCYPDAWYVHIVRDRDAVVKSLMRAPFMADRSFDACAGLWDRVVGDLRTTLGGLRHYREISYESLRSDPAHVCEELFAWLGVSSDDDVLETVRRLSREPFSDLGRAPAARGGRRARLAAASAGVQSRLGAAVDRLAERAPTAPADHLAFEFARAFRLRDAEAFRSLTAPSFELIYRSSGGDEVLRGDSGVAELVRIANETWTRRYVSEWWASSGTGPGDWWTSAPGKPLCTLFLSALGGDATRIDLAIALVVEDDRIKRAVVISAGPLAGRPVTGTAAPRHESTGELEAT